MTNYKFETMVIGRDAVPKYPRKSKWGYLVPIFNELNTGQAIRIVLPKGIPRSGVLQAWIRLTKVKKVISHSRTVKQPDGSQIIYLWYDRKVV